MYDYLANEEVQNEQRSTQSKVRILYYNNVINVNVYKYIIFPYLN